ncbi:MAG: carbohydrate ABC transporter permease [Nitrospiraceae bacterium]|nr:carbohydrate ABC transporter permease [Nitrospiraceae bacterium]
MMDGRTPRLRFIIMTVLAALWALPLAWVLLLSLKPNDVLRQGGLELFLPYPLTIEHYATLMSVSQTPGWLLNSVMVAGSMTVLTLTLSTLCGYALARIPFRGQRTLWLFILAGLMIPSQAVLFPLHELFARWNLHNTHLALVAPHLAVPFGSLLMMQFFQAVPRELEEAAQLDHAGRFTIFFTIMLPLSRPALTTLAVFTFLTAWNDFFWPLVSATDTASYTITVGLSSLQGNFAQSEGLGFIMASAIFASVPIVVVYLSFQRHIIRGFAFGGK